MCVGQIISYYIALNSERRQLRTVSELNHSAATCFTSMCLLEELHGAARQVVHRAHQPDPTLRRPCLPFRGFEKLAHRVTHVGFARRAQHCSGRHGSIEAVECGPDVLQKHGDTAVILLIVEFRTDRRRYRAAACVPQYDEQWRAQMHTSVLQGPEYGRTQHVSRYTDHEQLAEAGVEDQLRRHSAVAASQDGGVGLLVLGEFSQHFFLHRREARAPVDEARVAVLQPLECLVRAVRGRHVRFLSERLASLLRLLGQGFSIGGTKFKTAILLDTQTPPYPYSSSRGCHLPRSALRRPVQKSP